MPSSPGAAKLTTRAFDSVLFPHRFEEPHAWLYSDGSTVCGVHGGGKKLAEWAPSFRSGDTVTVCLDFRQDRASWFLNLDDPSRATLAYTLRELPRNGASWNDLYAVVVLDEANDAVRFIPFVSAAERRCGALLLAASNWYDCDVSQKRICTDERAIPTRVQGPALCDEGVSYVASRIVRTALARWANPPSPSSPDLWMCFQDCYLESGVSEEIHAACPPWAPRPAWHQVHATFGSEIIGWTAEDADDEAEDDHAGWQAMAGG